MDRSDPKNGSGSEERVVSEVVNYDTIGRESDGNQKKEKRE